MNICELYNILMHGIDDVHMGLTRAQFKSFVNRAQIDPNQSLSINEMKLCIEILVERFEMDLEMFNYPLRRDIPVTEYEEKQAQVFFDRKSQFYKNVKYLKKVLAD